MALTPKMTLFCEEYLVDLNATQAAIRAGYSAKTASEQGARLLANVRVAAHVADLMAERSKRTQITADRVLREYEIIAFGTLDDVAPWDEQGPHLIPSADLPREKRAMVSSIKVKREREWRGKGDNAEPWDVETMEIKPWDKLNALEKLGKHLGMWSDKVEHTGEMTVKVVRG